MVMSDFSSLACILICIFDAVINGGAKLLEVAIKLIVQTFFDKLPKSFNQVQVRRITRQKD